MKSCVLRFPGHAHADLVLASGATAIGRDPDHERGLHTLPLGQASLVEIMVDARGIWMSVSPGTWGVHVNGRPVQHIAMLHAGDTLHVEGMEMLLVCTRSDDPAAMVEPAAVLPSRQWELVQVLRGLGGTHHGLALPVRASDSGALHVDGLAIELDGSAVAVRCEDPAMRLSVNGQVMQEATLRVGDQLTSPNGQRFLLEGPDRRSELLAAPATALDRPAAAAAVDAVPGRFRLPWLLLAAVCIALVLLALFWFGV